MSTARVFREISSKHRQQVDNNVVAADGPWRLIPKNKCATGRP